MFDPAAVEASLRLPGAGAVPGTRLGTAEPGDLDRAAATWCGLEAFLATCPTKKCFAFGTGSMNKPLWFLHYISPPVPF